MVALNGDGDLFEVHVQTQFEHRVGIALRGVL